MPVLIPRDSCRINRLSIAVPTMIERHDMVIAHQAIGNWFHAVSVESRCMRKQYR